VEDLALLGLLAHVQSLTCGAAHIAVSLFTGASRAYVGIACEVPVGRVPSTRSLPVAPPPASPRRGLRSRRSDRRDRAPRLPRAARARCPCSIPSPQTASRAAVPMDGRAAAPRGKSLLA